MIVKKMPYETLVKKVKELEAKRLYAHRIWINKSSYQSKDNVNFNIYLTVYRNKSDKLTVPDIFEDVKRGTCQNLNLTDDSDGYAIPISWDMVSSGNISISYYQNGSGNLLTYTAEEYTITDTVTEV